MENTRDTLKLAKDSHENAKILVQNPEQTILSSNQHSWTSV